MKRRIDIGYRFFVEPVIVCRHYLTAYNAAFSAFRVAQHNVAVGLLSITINLLE